MLPLICISGVIVVFISVLIINTLIAKNEAPKLSDRTLNYSEEDIEYYTDRLGEMIRCKTVSVKDSYDDTEFKKLRHTMEILFPKVHERAEKMTFSDDCWIYKIKGKDESRNIMLMSHHDVVDVSGEWEHDGFCGEVFDGKIWGRGTVDTKTPLFCEFSALEELLREGFEPPCNIYIGSSHNEELGGDGIPKANEYFKEHNIKFEVILDEGGAVIDPPLAGMNCKKCAMIAVHEKGRHTLICKATQGNAHASLTAGQKDTTVERMSKFINEISSNQNKIFIRRMNKQVIDMFSHLAPYMNFTFGLVFSNLWCFKPVLRKIMPKMGGQVAGLIGTTCTFNFIEGSTQSKECTAKMFIRAVDDKDLSKDLETIKEIAEKYDIELTDDVGCEYHAPANIGKPPFEYTKKCVNEVFPDVPPIPFILPAGTDARTLTDVCDCVLRFAPIRLSAQQLASVHSENENIDADAVVQCVEFYKYFVENYK